MSRNASSPTILVVEDEVGIAEALAQLLEFEGFQVLLAGNGQRGIETLALHRCDLIITDGTMPVMGGGQFIQHVRAEPDTASIPIIFTSAAAEPDPVALRMADAFLSKPFMIVRLLELIRQLLPSGRR